MNTSAGQPNDPMREAVFSLLPHFGITEAASVEEAITKLTTEMSRIKEADPERYQTMLLQAKSEVLAFNALLDQYKVEIEKVKNGTEH